MPEPLQTTREPAEKRTELAPQPAAPPPNTVPRPVAEILRSPGAGEPLPTQVAEPIAKSLRVDVKTVRVHTDGRSRAAAAMLKARAFAWGTHVFLGPGEKPIDLPLLAHEVVHVVQQQGAGGPAVRLFTSASPEPYEREAQAVSAAVVRGERAAVGGRTGGPRIQGLLDWAKKGISAIGRGISAAASAIAELGEGVINAAINFVKDKAKSIPGYDVLAFILGRDPITQQPVERTALNLIKALVGLIPGGTTMFENIQKAGVIQRAYDWFSGEIGKLGLTWPYIRGLFQQAWDALSASDLLSPGTAWEKLKKIFGPPIGKIVDFALAAGKKILEFVFEGALALGGGAAQQVLGFFRKVQAVFSIIVADPVKFFSNLVQAVKGGFQKFAANIVEHLKKAIFDWLFGALQGALRLPKKFDLMGIVDIILQVLGLTYDRLRAKLVKLLGEPAVKFIETAFDFLKTLVTEGIAAAWKKLLEFATGLVDTAIAAIRDWVVKTIVQAAITKLVTMFNPLGAIIQAIIGIYNTVMFFIERAKQIAAFLEAVVNSIENIAMGRLQAAIDYVEKTLARVLVLIISFLARFIGLGGVADAVKGVIKKIQDTVDKAIDKVIAWVQNAVKSLIGKGEKPAAKPEAAAIPEKTFAGHKIWFKQAGRDAVPTIESEPKPLSTFLAELGKLNLSEAKKKTLKDAQDIVGKMDPIADRLLTADPANVALDADRKKVLEYEEQLVPLLQKLLEGVDLKEFNEIYSLEGVTGPYSSMPTQKRDLLTPDHQPQAAVLIYTATNVFKAPKGPGSKTPLFKGAKLEEAASGHAKGGWTVNLHDRRHKLGRTWGYKSKATLPPAKNALDAINADEKATPEEKRTKVIQVLRGELNDDVSAMLTVVTAEDEKTWGDIQARIPKPEEAKPFIQKVRDQIKAGEGRMRVQDLEGYKTGAKD